MKILPVIGRQARARKFWEGLVALGVKEDYDNPDAILVLGGDGRFLGAQRDYYKMGKPFVGVGFGSVNFLLNRTIDSPKKLYEKLKQNDWTTFDIGGLRAQIRTVDGLCKGIAFNDIYFKSTDPTGVIRLELNTREFVGMEVAGDGLIVASPQGSTAYNRTAGGTILPLGSTLWCLTGICTQKKLRVTVAQQEISVQVVRGDAIVVTDNKAFSNVEEVIITPSQYSTTICFDAKENFEQRRYNE